MTTESILYPSTSTVAVTITLASLASGSSGVFTVGRESAAISNTDNDVDHILRGVITTGTSPTAARYIQVYAFIPRSIASGTATWPDVMTGSDAARSVTSANVMMAALRLVASFAVDSTSSRAYDFSGVSVASLFGGSMPSKYGLFVAHDTGVALHATGGNHVISYERIKYQSA
jgi:hypothetical protein